MINYFICYCIVNLILFYYTMATNEGLKAAFNRCESVINGNKLARIWYTILMVVFALLAQIPLRIIGFIIRCIHFFKNR